MQNICWKFRDSLIEPGEIVDFAKKYSLSSIIATLLLNRNIKSEEQVNEYIKKSLDAVKNPNGLNDMEKAAKRIVKAINENEKITIYGDYDADGVTATVLLYNFLRDNGAHVDYYIPDRIKEGYGLNIMAVNRISKKGTKLLITVDCGIACVGEIELAKAQKMEVIVTDHHTCGDKIPDAYAVINPKRKDSTYGYEALAGVGVAFKLALSVTMEFGKSTKECFLKYVEFAAIGTIGDVVSLQGENRIIVDRGLKAILKTENYGIKALIEMCGIRDSVTASDIAFSITPKINAAGRMENAGIAVDLFLAQSFEEAYRLAVNLDEINKNRQKEEQIMLREALEMIQNDPEFSKKKITVLAKEGWNQGIIGIVAARITEMFYKPCIIISTENGKAKGSGRSVDGINLFEVLKSTSEILTQFGGHSQAAGLSLNADDIDEFAIRADKFIKENFKEDLKRTLHIDCSVPSAFLTVKNAKQLEYLEPYGMDNDKPVFAMRGVKIQYSKAVGMDERHLKLKIETESGVFDAIWFSGGMYQDRLAQGRIIDIAFNLEINNYNGTQSVQLLVKDIK